MKIRRSFGFAAILALIAVPLSAQQKRPLDHDAYDIWNRIQNDVVSADGAWLAYRLVPGDGDATLMVRSLSGERSLTIERGTAPSFSSDSRRLVARIAPMQQAVEAAAEDDDLESPNDSLVIVELSDLSMVRVPDVQSFALAEDDGRWLAYLLDEGEEDAEADAPSEADEASESDDEDEAPRDDDGTELVLRELSSEREVRFDHVRAYEFAADGSALYYTASGEDGAADGVFKVVDGEASAILRGEGRYTRLTVSETGVVAFLTDRDDRSADVQRYALYVGDGMMTSSAAARGVAGLPAGWAPSHNGGLSFSDSGDRLFFGSAPAPEPEPEDDTPDDERVVVDIWNWKDPYLQPMQLVQADRERERTWSAMYDLEAGRIVQLADPDMPDVVATAEQGDGDVALGRSDLPYRQLVSWDGRYADLFLIDVESGERTPIAEMVRGFPSLSPGGSYVTWWDGFDKVWYAVDVETRERIDLTGAIGVPFHDILDDHPDALRSYGSAGWTEGDESFVVYDQFDAWAIDPSGSRAPRNLTEGVGRENDTRFRVLDLDTDDPYVPSDEDVYLNAFHLYTKANGIYRDRFDGTREPQRLVMDDVRFSAVRKAEEADVFVFERSTFEEFPDVWVTDRDFRSPRKVTDANPQQSEYSWGTAEIVEWTSNDGIPLQGILYKPEGFDPNEEYPMMVYFYERSSDGLHGYTVPAAGGSSINRSFYVSRGYLLFVPDIPYRIGYPGESALDAVVPGVLEVVDEGFVDRERIGVQGHSWGGYQIAYMITRTDLFAAAEAGAPVANMVSAYGGIRWGTGMSRMFQYERTQSRIGGTLWETPLRYIENSPIFTADKINTPLLMMHNDEDTAVPWYQGIELFVALRRLQQPVWMLNYNGEPHGLRKPQNQKDWAVRMQQFFDHYLQDDPAPVWMEEGVPATLKGKTLGLGKTKIISDDDDPATGR